ncbi:PREDICTED: putative F-box protein At5g52620 [Camelina sativa]|uniref:F-box protein At5g52620 n=1 Tax=Camelina sativa TaxID=90675 RepID=A0ABM0UL81_CAMSA|nr:PREDICTED: putative F-box protein At5g52620 [Camelina sativa]
MEREDNSDPIPIDILLEILSRSSTKSIARFGLASKFCASLLRGPDFTELFLTRPSTRPRLLFAVGNSDEWRFYSSPQNPDEDHSLEVVSADFHMQLPKDMVGKEIFGPVSGLLYFPNMGTDTVPVICNPMTGLLKRLTQITSKYNPTSLLGYDLIGKQYKVLSIIYSPYGSEEHVSTLGTRDVSWRKVRCHVNHDPPIKEGICINGVLYYIVDVYRNKLLKIGCFDVRSEKLRFLHKDSTTMSLSSCLSPIKLINYKGKLGVISWSWNCYRDVIKFCLWILEDDQKQEWLKREYTLPVYTGVKNNAYVVAGVTATGEIIVSMNKKFKPFLVYYFNPERNTLKKVRIPGLEASEDYSRVQAFVDYAEDLKCI